MNQNIYRTEFFAACPENEIRVKYTLTIRSTRMIFVEKIIDAVSRFTRGYHEQIADDLFREFGGDQTLAAEHHGVKITTVRGRE